MLIRATTTSKTSIPGLRRFLRSPETTLTITVIVSFFLVASAAIFAYMHSSRAIQSAEGIEKSQELLGCLESSLSTMKDMVFQAETYIKRGFIGARSRYTGDKATLNGYIQFVRSVGDEEGWRRWHFTYLEQLAQKFQNTLDKAIKDKESGNSESALVGLNKAQQLLEVIRGRLIISDVDERVLLKERLSEYTHHAQRTSMMFLSLGGFIILFVVPLTFLVQRYLGATRKALLVEQQVSREIVKHAPIGILQLSPDFRIKDANAVFESFLSGIDFAVDDSVFDFLPELPREVLVETVTFGKPAILRSVYISKFGDQTRRERCWDIAAWPMVEEGNVRSLIILIEDISEKTTLSHQKEVLQQTIAHDLKSPLIASNYLIQAVLKKYSASSNGAHELLLRLQDSNENALSMVKNMLEIAKYRQGAEVLLQHEILLDELIDNIAGGLASRCQLAEVSIEIDKSAEPICIYSDQAALTHMIGNLLENAIKFSRAQGRIRVTLSKSLEDVSISVNNTGSAIHEKDREKLFTPFWQGELGQKSPGGTGIGLYLCREIAQALGGNITFTSHEDSGTTFTVILPCTNNVPSTA